MADEDLSHNYQRPHHHHHHHRNNQDDDEMVNIFDELKKRKSILLTLFDARNENNELLNVATQAPAPSKDYCQLVLTYRQVIYRCWRIALRGDSESRYPREVRDNYEDFAYDENTQREIGHVFGKPTLVYVRNIVEKGKLDYLARLPTKILIKIISFLNLEDIARLSQVNSQFRQLCRSDSVWMELYKTYYSNEITSDLKRLAERDGWRKVFFTNKIKLQLELRRQSKMIKPKPKVKGGKQSTKSTTNQRRVKYDSDNEDTNPDDLIETISSSKFRHSTFLTEN